MKGLIFKRDLGLISGIYDRKRNDLRWQEMPYTEGIRSPFFIYLSNARSSLEATHMLETVLKSFLSASNMKIINNFTLICTFLIIQFLVSQRTSKSLRSAKVHFIFCPGGLGPDRSHKCSERKAEKEQ